MKKALSTAAILLMCAQAAAAQTAVGPRRPSLPLAGAVTNPDWVRRPTGEDMARVYPRIAQAMELPGNALIQCTVNVGGDVEGCTVSSETPAGLGFGQAAIVLSSSFKMKPRTVDGVAVGGATVRIPIAFRVRQNEAPTPPPPAAAGPAPNEAALALGRRIAVGTGVDAFIDEILDTTVKQLRATEYAASSGADASGQEVALQAIVDAFKAERQPLIDEFARVYAAQFDQKELALLAAHFESPAQKLWQSKQSAMAPSGANIRRRIFADITKAAREHFCQKTTCLDSAPASKPQDQGAKP